MILEAMVSESTFREMAEDIAPFNLKGVMFFEGVLDRPGYPIITAEATPDEVLELAQSVSANAITDPTDIRWDRLVITAHREAPDYRYDNISGQICFWSSDLGGTL